jgi:3-deoxy-7-phosphoheptulonate synthase
MLTQTIKTRDLRVESIRPLVPPGLLLEELKLGDAAAASVARAREEVVRVLDKEDDRLVVVVGPCSIHDPEAGLEYARRLKPLADDLADDLLIVMRTYFEKPRTTVGWKGLINDPHLNGTFEINEGLRLARRFLLDVVGLGLPAGCEFLDPISPQFFSDIVAWGAIGARTTESQIHRQLASGLSMPIGFKNGTDGDVQIALDAMRAAAHPHSFFGVTEAGLAGIVTTRGNDDCHLILRGGRRGTNFDAATIGQVLDQLHKAHLPERVMVDASHGNSNKDHRNQPGVLQQVGAQLAAGQDGISGVMLESFLVDGRQELVDPRRLTFGQSITDACIGWETTEEALRELAGAVRARRAA